MNRGAVIFLVCHTALQTLWTGVPKKEKKKERRRRRRRDNRKKAKYAAFQCVR